MSVSNQKNLINPTPASFRKRVLLTTAEAAEFIGKSEPALSMMRHKCEGPKYYKIGRSVRYDLQDLEDWIDSCLVDPQEI